MDKGFLLYDFLGVALSHFIVKNVYIDCKDKIFLLYVFFGASSKFFFLKMILYIGKVSHQEGF